MFSVGVVGDVVVFLGFTTVESRSLSRCLIWCTSLCVLSLILSIPVGPSSSSTVRSSMLREEHPTPLVAEEMSSLDGVEGLVMERSDGDRWCFDLNLPKLNKDPPCKKFDIGVPG